METIEYKNKVCIVTGAASGMGLCVTKMLLDMGAEVYAADIKDVPASVKKHIHLDLGNLDSIDKAVAQMPQHIDCVFNCAGIAGTHYAGREFDAIDVVKINFLGPQYLVESLLPKMTAGGSIGLIASVGGMSWKHALKSAIAPFLALPSYDERIKWLEENRENDDAIGGIDLVNRPYTFSKECLIVFAKRMSWVLASKKIRINTISPAITATPMQADFNRVSGCDVASLSLSPVGEMPVIEDHAKAILYLNSDYASYISGVDLQIDFGYAGGLLSKG